MALDPGILPGPARSRAKARFLLATSATCGGGAHPCAYIRRQSGGTGLFGLVAGETARFRVVHQVKDA
jgi:hypothetical protein